MQTPTNTPLCPRWLLGAAALGLYAAALPCSLAQTTPGAAAIPTARVHRTSVANGYVLDGVVQAVQQSTVAAQTTGRITRWNVKAGDRVRAGQELATIDDREAQVGMQQSQAQLSQADSALRTARSQVERTRTLQAQGFVSQAALDMADNQHQAAQAQRAQAAAATRQSGLAQGYTRVTSPLDGWVLQTFAQAGDLAVPGTPLLVVYAPQPLRAVVQVPASRNQAVRQANQAQVLVDALGVPHSITPLSRLEVPSSDPVSQTTEWRLDLPAKEATSLLPGQQLRVRFGSTDHATPRLQVPASAVVRRGELNAVYVQSATGFALRAVRLGAQSPQSDGAVEVLAGLQDGEVVATDTLRAAQAPLKSSP